MHLNKPIAMSALLACISGATVWACPQRPANKSDVTAGNVPDQRETRSSLSSREKSIFTPASSRTMPENLLRDQRAIWSSPARLRWNDANWLVPLGGLSAWLVVTDRQFSTHLSNDPRKLRNYRHASDIGAGALVAVTGGLYAWGALVHDEHRRETGMLAGEAALNSFFVNTAVKYATGRARPLDDGSRGGFGRGGTSFPSQHATLAWSVASVLAHEYPGPLTKLLAYGAASAVSLSRMRAREHFPSDVLIGSAIGWFVGEQIYRAHHDPELGGTAAGNESSVGSEEGRGPWSGPSAYVPLESWVYPALERLAGSGYVRTAILGMKPWTRTECARLTEEAREELDERSQEGNAGDALSIQLENQLEQEFNIREEQTSGTHGASFHFDSIYGRVVSVNGPLLNDGFHFGQTISYDSGRPIRRGTNAQLGASARATAGMWLFSVRAELQHSPGAPALSSQIRNIIAIRDVTPIQPAQIYGGVDRVRLLDAYVGLNVKNWQLTFGNQSLSWGPGAGGSLLLSNNAEPLGMLRLTRVVPFTLPSVLRFLGPVRVDQFVGRAVGGNFIPNPLIYGQKISFRPSSYFEMGFARTVTLGGRGGDPFTPYNFYRSFFGRQVKSYGINSGIPGDSRAQVDWTLRVPGLRNYVVVYLDGEADDDESPYLRPSRSVWRPGIYLTRVPKLPRLDLRLEATSSESPGFKRDRQGHLNYWHYIYRDGYTNNGFLLANAVGREGKNVQLWSNYWISPLNQLKFGLKLNVVDASFMPGGGSWSDYSVAHEIYLPSGVYVKSFFQYERIGHFPILFTGSVSNVTAWLEMGFSPGRQKQ